jgi:hypothetical protein
LSRTGVIDEDNGITFEEYECFECGEYFYNHIEEDEIDG